MKTTRIKNGMRLASFIAISMLALWGCQEENNDPVGATSAGEPRTLYRTGDTSTCLTVSTILQPNQGPELRIGDSKVKFSNGSVLLPTLVSFNICRLDTIGTLLRSKAVVMGPISNLIYLRAFKVELMPVDAGLPANIADGTWYTIFRKSEFTGLWDSVFFDRLSGHKVKYEVNRNGTYAVSLSNLPIDTTWTVGGIVTPSGGSITNLTSTLVIPSGSLIQSTYITFSITEATPSGLPGATNRVFDFAPEGLNFQASATLYVSFEDAGLDGEKIRSVRFYYFNPVSNSWVRQPTSTDWANRRFVVTLAHFSRYAFGR